MTKKTISILARFSSRFLVKCTVAVGLLALSFGCKKNSMGTGNQAGAGALLIKVLKIGYNGSGVKIDSSVVTISWAPDSQIVQTFQIEIMYEQGLTLIDSLTTFYTYNGNQISSTQQLITTQTDVTGNPPAGLDDTVNSTFFTSGGQVTNLVQVGTISSYGFSPPQNGQTIDSGSLTYNANGSVATYNTYQSSNGSAYAPVFDQAFSYSGNNLAGYVLTNTDPLAPGNTTATYTYNNHVSASALYNVIPGITLPSSNDVSELTLDQVGGIYPGQTTYTYHSTYNGLNQPISSSVIVSTTVTAQAYLLLTPVTEKISYFYQ
jgi:hypothetical protein